MNEILAVPVHREISRQWLPTFRGVGPLIILWILTWTVIFSAVDFWSIKIYEVEKYSWFGASRAAIEVGGSLVSPASLAFAENAYFVWMNAFDGDHAMHEWEWYNGDPVNPDGSFNFVWGDGQGGWMKYPMWEWYGVWLLITSAWFAGLARVRLRRRRVRSNWI